VEAHCLPSFNGCIEHRTCCAISSSVAAAAVNHPSPEVQRPFPTLIVNARWAALLKRDPPSEVLRLLLLWGSVVALQPSADGRRVVAGPSPSPPLPGRPNGRGATL